MLRKDRNDTPDAETLLFRVPGTNEPLTVGNNAEDFARFTKSIGIDTTRFTPYSLRKGGTSAYSASEKGSEAIAQAVGG